jgi:NADPH-dependent ferric siderophore reductase
MRVLLLAGSSTPWPAIRAELEKLPATADSRALRLARP